MKKQIRAIDNENTSLETRITSLSSYVDLDEKVKTLGMVSIDKIKYIETKDGSVAMK